MKVDPWSASLARLKGRRTALVLPRDAVGADGLVLVLEDGRATSRAVTFGGDLGDGRVEVVSGLSAGERVVRAGP